MTRWIVIFCVAAMLLTLAPTFAEEAPLSGDADLDGRVTAADASAILRHVVKLETLEGQALINADVNLDGQVTSADAVLIVRALVGMDRMPVPTPLAGDTGSDGTEEETYVLRQLRKSAARRRTLLSDLRNAGPGEASDGSRRIPRADPGSRTGF